MRNPADTNGRDCRNCIHAKVRVPDVLNIRDPLEDSRFRGPCAAGPVRCVKGGWDTAFHHGYKTVASFMDKPRKRFAAFCPHFDCDG